MEGQNIITSQFFHKIMLRLKEWHNTEVEGFERE